MARTMSVPCRRDLACFRNDGHDGDHAYATPDTVPSPAPIWQAGYDAGYREPQEDAAIQIAQGQRMLAASEREITRLNARIVDLNAEVLDRMDQWHRDSLARDELARQQNREITRLRNLSARSVATCRSLASGR